MLTAPPPLSMYSCMGLHTRSGWMNGWGRVDKDEWMRSGWGRVDKDEWMTSGWVDGDEWVRSGWGRVEERGVDNDEYVMIGLGWETVGSTHTHTHTQTHTHTHTNTHTHTHIHTWFPSRNAICRPLSSLRKRFMAVSTTVMESLSVGIMCMCVWGEVRWSRGQMNYIHNT
jgi:hypothetical protein